MSKQIKNTHYRVTLLAISRQNTQALLSRTHCFIYRLYSLGRRSQIVSKVSCHPETRLFSNNENSHKRYSLTLLLLQRNGAIFELIAALLIFLKLILQKRGVRIVMGALSVKVT